MKPKSSNYFWWWLWISDTKKKQNKLEEAFSLLSVFHSLIYIDCGREVLDYMLSYYLLSEYFLQCPAIPSWLCHHSGNALVNYKTEISHVDAYLTILFLSLSRPKLITTATGLFWSTPGWPKGFLWMWATVFFEKVKKGKTISPLNFATYHRKMCRQVVWKAELCLHKKIARPSRDWRCIKRILGVTRMKPTDVQDRK